MYPQTVDLVLSSTFLISDKVAVGVVDIRGVRCFWPRQLKRLTFCDPYVFLKRFYEIQANIETHVWQTSCVYYTQMMKKCNNIVINAL